MLHLESRALAPTTAHEHTSINLPLHLTPSQPRYFAPVHLRFSHILELWLASKFVLGLQSVRYVGMASKFSFTIPGKTKSKRARSIYFVSPWEARFFDKEADIPDSTEIFHHNFPSIPSTQYHILDVYSVQRFYLAHHVFSTRCYLSH